LLKESYIAVFGDPIDLGRPAYLQGCTLVESRPAIACHIAA
jgi:hypothetical protein